MAENSVRVICGAIDGGVKFFPLIAVGFWVNALTGIVLTMLAARSFFSNPDFYIKLVAIAGALVTLRMLRAGLFRDPVVTDLGPVPLKTRIVAVAMLVFWAVAVTAGRLTAYSPSVRSSSAVAILVAAVLLLLVRHMAARVWRPTEQPIAPVATHAST